MIPFSTAGQVVLVYLLVIVLGALGGLAASLLMHGAAGRLEMPRRGRRNGERFYDLGFLSEIIVGVVAACAVLWLVELGETTSGGEVVAAYPAQVLIGLCLIAGAAGGALLAGLAQRAQQLALGREAIIGRDTALVGLRMAMSAAEKQAAISPLRGMDGLALEASVPVPTLQAIIEHVEPAEVELRDEATKVFKKEVEEALEVTAEESQQAATEAIEVATAKPSEAQTPEETSKSA